MNNLKITTQLSYAFGVLVLALGALGWIAFVKVNDVADLTYKLHRHPLAVSNAILEANAHIIAMHRGMKDVALAPNTEEMDAAQQVVMMHEQKVFEQFDIVQDRFLGDLKRVEAARQLIEDWRPIRMEVIDLMKAGQREAAATITKGRGADHVAKIDETMNFFITFAKGKADEFMAKATDARETVLTTILTLVITFVVLGAALAFYIGRKISHPVQGLSQTMSLLADGKLDNTVPYQNQKNEIGDMAKKIAYFQDQLRKVKLLEQEQSEQEERLAQERQQAREVLAQEFEQNVGQVVHSLMAAADMMQGSAQDMSQSAAETSQEVRYVADVSQEAEGEVQVATQAVEQLAQTQHDVGSHVQESAQITQGASQQAVAMKTAVVKMVEEVEQIESIVDLIADIAEQTNLLALNATIEAARAGAAGKGFAVVASEVKNLAKQTAVATENITRQMSAVQGVTQQVADDIEEVSLTVEKVSEIGSAIASAMDDQSRVSQNIAHCMQTVAQGTQGVGVKIQQVDQAAQKTDGAAAQILDAAQGVSQQASSLESSVRSFLHKMREDG